MIDRKSIYGFWICPDGVIYTIEEEFGHKKFVECLNETKYYSNEDCTNALLDKGWIRIVNMSKSFMIDYKKINKAQIVSLSKTNNILENNGYFHDNYIVSSVNNYQMFDNFKKTLNFMKTCAKQK